MDYQFYLQEAWRNLFYFKLRSMLALLGVLVGTASVVAMVLCGQLATHEALKQFASLGTDLLSLTVMSDQASVADNATHLTLPQAFSLSSSSQAIETAAPYTQVYLPILYEGQVIQGATLGVTDDFAEVAHISMASGRFVSVMDQYAAYCVIGHGIYQQLKTKSLAEPLGKTLAVGTHLCRIIGVANTWQANQFINADIDQVVMVPLLNSTLMTEYATINQMIFKLKPNTDILATEAAILAKAQSLLPEHKLIFHSAKELIAKMEKQNDILTIFLGFIGGISLVVGGIGVMNIMLVSVVERRREIGIRLAVGATRRDIQRLFLAEAVMLSLTGGMLGVLLGMLVASIAAWWFQWEWIGALSPLFVGFTVSVAVGIFFGFYPARLAAQSDPIVALRAD